jgi:hypothetical protein
MGYWVNTTYVRHGNAGEVAEAISDLFRQEGMQCIPAPAQRERLMVEPMQYDCALHNDLWGAAIFPGAPCWTVIQTAPLELLVERAPGAARMRLADLCIRLSASAFQLNVYDGTAMVLAEVSDRGELFLSGCNSATPDPFKWNDEQLSKQLFEGRFQWHPFQDLIAGHLLAEDKAMAIAQRFGGENASGCDNLVSVDTLICRKPLVIAGGMALYFKWNGPSRQRYSPCVSWDEYRSKTST